VSKRALTNAEEKLLIKCISWNVTFSLTGNVVEGALNARRLEDLE
jgi:hypothetical protein